jgi:tetraacyldisaccharide 4'-kinase
MQIELAILWLIEKDKLKTLRYLLSKIYEFIIYLRNFAYDRGIFATQKVKQPVISIGNIKAGGTGKTPFCVKIARDLSEKVACTILYRGYRATSSCPMGDEGALVQKRLPKVRVLAGKNRAALANLCKEGVIVLDDGMQHRRLCRDEEIVCMQMDDLLGGGYFLPRGYLRDTPKRLKEATLIVLGGDPALFEKSKKILAGYTKAPIIGVEKKCSGFIGLDGHVYSDLETKEVSLFSAIAHPKAFEKTMQDLGFHIKEHAILPDHATFSEKDLRKLGGPLVCTEKDLVKIKGINLPIFALKIDLSIFEGEEIYRALLDKMVNFSKKGLICPTLSK